MSDGPFDKFTFPPIDGRLSPEKGGEQQETHAWKIAFFTHEFISRIYRPNFLFEYAFIKYKYGDSSDTYEIL